MYGTADAELDGGTAAVPREVLVPALPTNLDQVAFTIAPTAAMQPRTPQALSGARLMSPARVGPQNARPAAVVGTGLMGPLVTEKPYAWWRPTSGISGTSANMAAEAICAVPSTGCPRTRSKIRPLTSVPTV